MAKQRARRGGRPIRRERNERYTKASLYRDRQYGFYWYSWLWHILRPVLVFACAAIIVCGLMVSGWNAVNHAFFMATDATDNATVDFTIERGSTIAKIGENLETQNLIRNAGVFKAIVQFQGLTSKIQYGNYPLSRAMDINQIIEKLTEGSASNERTITIIPGWTVEQIADYLLRQNAITDKDGFLALCNDVSAFKDSSYALQNAVASGTIGERKYALEGYLAPDTYRVYTNATPEAILITLLRQMDTVTDAVFNTAPAVDRIYDEFGNLIGADGTTSETEGGDTTDTTDTADNPETPAEDAAEVVFTTTLTDEQTLVLASIIEREAGKRADYPKVAAVFHNRLERGMRLESDATVSYPLGINRLILTASELATVNGYNTYTRNGLPVGPICNPSRAAIQAARYPDTDYIYDGYLYFCTGDPDAGDLVFAKTQDEHLANVARYRSLWMQYDLKKQKEAAS